MSELSEILKGYMAEKGLTEKELAKKSGVPNTSISNYLLEYSTPNFDHFVLLLYALDCSAEYLLGINDVHTSEPLHSVLPLARTCTLRVITCATRVEEYFHNELPAAIQFMLASASNSRAERRNSRN